VLHFLGDAKEQKEEPYPLEECTIGTIGHKEWQWPFENSYKPVIVAFICQGSYPPVLWLQLKTFCQ
jgi:hypothetical protein